MKLCVKFVRRAAAAAALSAALCFAGCASAQPRDPLSYQRSALRADFILTLGADDPAPSRLTVEKAGEGAPCRLTFTGGRLAGATVTVGADGVALSDGSGFSVPLDCVPGSPLRAVASGFAVAQSDVTSLSSDADGDRVTALCDGGTVTVTLRGGTPVRLDFDTLCGSFSLAAAEDGEDGGN